MSTLIGARWVKNLKVGEPSNQGFSTKIVSAKILWFLKNVCLLFGLEINCFQTIFLFLVKSHILLSRYTIHLGGLVICT